MQLFIMRHAQASMNADSDFDRVITAHGKQEIVDMAKWLNNTGIKISKLLVSPFVRTQQTANTLTAYLKDPISIITTDLLTPSGNAQNTHDYIDAFYSGHNDESLLIISHMPLVSYLVSELTVEQQSPIFPTAGIAQIQYDIQAMRGTLKTMVSPKDLASKDV